MTLPGHLNGDLTVKAVKAALADLESYYRKRKRALNALQRVLELQDECFGGGDTSCTEEPEPAKDE